MIDKSKWSPEELFVFEQYAYRCVLHPWAWADSLHHDPPRSLNPNWKEEIWTQYPVCASCHDIFQRMPRDEAQVILTGSQETQYLGAIERIKEYAARTT